MCEFFQRYGKMAFIKRIFVHQLFHFFRFLKSSKRNIPYRYILIQLTTKKNKNSRDYSFSKIFNSFKKFSSTSNHPHPLSYPTTAITLAHSHRLLAFNRISASTAAHSDVCGGGRKRRAKENKGGARREGEGEEEARARAVIWIPSELSSRLAAGPVE